MKTSQEAAEELRTPANANAGDLLRVPVLGHGMGVDREAENKCGGKGIIRGVVMAQMGPFKSEGRGEFDLIALQTVQRLTSSAPNGNKCRLAHPDESHDGVDKTLGRFYDTRLDTVAERDSEGTLKTDTIPCVRGDLHLNPAADKGPFKMGDYVMTLAETDPDIFSTSLVLQTEKEFRLNPDGTPQVDADGERLPPLWRPTKIMACDVVSTGDACDGLLAKMGGDVETLSGLPNGTVFQGVAMLDKQFAGKPRSFVEGHCLGFLRRYLDRRYGSGELAAGSTEQGASLRAAVQEVLAVLRGQTWLYHTLHWQSAGANSYGQHLLFERLYTAIPEQYDALAEKAVALFGAAVVEPVTAILSAAGHLGRWAGDALTAGLAAEADLSATLADALDEAEADPGLTNFLQGVADAHQTHVYLLQQVQGGKQAEEAMRAKPLRFANVLKSERQQRLAKMLLESLAAGPGEGEPGSPDASDPPAEDPTGTEGGNVAALHDGCRSTLAYHHQTLCRLCGGTMAACGCRDAGIESRVVTMAKQPCAACQAKAAEPKEAAGDEPPPAAEADAPDVDLAKAKLFVLDLE